MPYLIVTKWRHMAPVVTWANVDLLSAGYSAINSIVIFTWILTISIPNMYVEVYSQASQLQWVKSGHCT